MRPTRGACRAQLRWAFVPACARELAPGPAARARFFDLFLSLPRWLAGYTRETEKSRRRPNGRARPDKLVCVVCEAL